MASIKISEHWVEIKPLFVFLVFCGGEGGEGGGQRYRYIRFIIHGHSIDAGKWKQIGDMLCECGQNLTRVISRICGENVLHTYADGIMCHCMRTCLFICFKAASKCTIQSIKMRTGNRFPSSIHIHRDSAEQIDFDTIWAVAFLKAFGLSSILNLYHSIGELLELFMCVGYNCWNECWVFSFENRTKHF